MNREATSRGPWLAEAMDAVAEIASQADSTGGAELESPSGPGYYTGLPPQIELLDDGRTARLLSPLSYFRQDSSEWPVPRGAELDGASIPRAFWTLIGGPFEGRYRNASIVHDHHCVIRVNSWRDTHRMFYEAMLCSGVSGTKAKIMYYAVNRFGPRWQPAEEGVFDPASTPPAPPSDEDAESILADVRLIAEQDPSPEAVEALARSRE